MGAHLINNIQMEISLLLFTLFLCKFLPFSFEPESQEPSCPCAGARIPLLLLGGAPSAGLPRLPLWGEQLTSQLSEPGTRLPVPPRR